MASLSDILSTLQNGVVAINNFGTQLKTTLTRISTRFGNYLLLSGGTLTGDLKITKASPILSIDKAASGQDNGVRGTTNLVARWFISLGNTTAETGANAGSNFSIYRYTDAGAFIGEALGINRATGAATFNANTVAILYTGAGGANLLLAGDGGVTPNKYIRAQAGNLEFINTGYTAVIATLTDAGELSWTGSAWTVYTPTVSALAGVVTTASATGRYKQNGKTVHFNVAVTITNPGTASSALTVTLPVAASASAFFCFAGREDAIVGSMCFSEIASTTSMYFQRYDGAYIGTAGMHFVFSGTYEAA